MGIKNALIGHKVMYYPKFHYELNYIEYFWYDGKVGHAVIANIL